LWSLGQGACKRRRAWQAGNGKDCGTNDLHFIKDFVKA